MTALCRKASPPEMNLRMRALVEHTLGQTAAYSLACANVFKLLIRKGNRCRQLYGSRMCSLACGKESATYCSPVHTSLQELGIFAPLGRKRIDIFPCPL